MFTEWSLEDDAQWSGSRRTLQRSFLITEHLEADKVWADGYDGAGVEVAVFDTGIDEHHPHFDHIEERTNWTNEDQLKDGIGHGSFVAGIIASKFAKCPGFAPNANINTFRVFTNAQMSYTSWFLDAFNYAIYRKMNILNLSIGGPDWLDIPFVEKVRELQANNVIMITACGNDGKYGTINNPADQLSVIGVGGITQDDAKIAGFQSRGMTTWELPRGYGRIKPDIVTVGQSLYGSSVDGGCRTLSGTSVASPVVTGVAALLTSVVPAGRRWDVVNPASLKQVLVESADPIDGLRMFEQGMGKINVPAAYRYIKHYEAHISAVPAALRLAEAECPRAWPFCRQPLYWSSEPYILNVTLLNPFSVVGEVESSPSFEISGIEFENGRSVSRAEIERNGDDYELISMEFKHSERLWPWSGWLGVYIYAQPQTAKMHIKSLSGTISLDIKVIGAGSSAGEGGRESQWETHSLSIEYSVSIIPTPDRRRRILWDQFHSMQYPMGYFPRDDLEHDSDMLDWFGDHPHSNYHRLYDFLKDKGYFVEVLRTDYSCIDPAHYGTLMVVDPEDQFDADEVAKIEHDVLHDALSVIVLADWYNERLMEESRFFDDNTRSVWDALTGGANVPALNDLLHPFGIAFGDLVVAGDLKVDGGHSLYFQTGNSIMRSPPHSRVLMTDSLHRIKSAKPKAKRDRTKVDSIPLTLFDVNHLDAATNGGRLAVFGDSRLDEASFWMIEMLLRFTANNELDRNLAAALTTLTEDNVDTVFGDDYLSTMSVPAVRESVRVQFDRLSRVHNLQQVECPEMLSFEARARSDSAESDRAARHRGYLVHNGPKMGRQIGASGDVQGADSKAKGKHSTKYKFVVEPHLYGHADPMEPGQLGMFEDVMFYYPVAVIAVLLAAIYCFCAPIRRLIPLRQCRLRTRLFSQRTYRKMKGDQYYHV